MKKILSETEENEDSASPPAAPPSTPAESEEPFTITFLIARSLIAKWSQKGGPKEKLELKQEKEPQKAAEIEEVIKNVEEAQKEVKAAADAFQEASKTISTSFDKDLGVTGKVQKFFGFDPSEVKTEKFSLKLDASEKPPQFHPDANGKYKIKDITSPGFNISYFLEDPKKAKELVIKMISYRDILDPEYQKNKDVIEDNLPTAAKIKTMLDDLKDSPLQESLFDVDSTEPPLEKIVKKKYIELLEKLFKILKTLEAKNLATTKAKLKIATAYRENPIVAVYYKFGKSDKLEKDLIMESFKNRTALIYKNDKIVDFLETIAIELNEEEDGLTWYKVTEKQIAQPVEQKDYKQLLTVFRSDQEKEEDVKRQATSKEVERLRTVFEQQLDKKLEELEKGIPLFVKGELDPFSDKRGDTSLDPVYAESDSIVRQFRNEPKKEEIITFLQSYIQGNKETAYKNMPMENTEQFKERLSMVDELIDARNKEAIRDLKALAKFLKDQEPKKAKDASGNITRTLQRNNIPTILALYRKWHDWMDKNKKDLLKHFEKNTTSSEEALEERIVKLIKPLLREKLKRKQNGKKNLCY